MVGDNETSDDPDWDEPAVHHPGHPERALSRTKLTLVIIPIAIMVTATQVANALWATLVNDHPELLISLSSLNRYLVAVVNKINPVAYYVIGSLRLLAPDPFFYILGYCYGDRAILWMEHRTPTFGKMMRSLERLFAKGGHILVLTLPNNYVCLIAGAAEMPILTFIVLDVVGTIGRLALLSWLGDIFSGPINRVLELVAQYRIPLLVISIAIVAFTVVREYRAGTTDIQQLIELEEELEAEADVED